MLLRLLIISLIISLGLGLSSCMTLPSFESESDDVKIKIEYENGNHHRRHEGPGYAPYDVSDHQNNDLWLRKQLCHDFDQVTHETKFSPPNDIAAIQKTYNAARKHNGAAQAELGDRYIDGDGLPKDWKKGLCWYRSAAANGSVYAEYWLGIFYQNGYVVEESLPMASFWFERAKAHANSAAAEFHVGERYANDDAGIHDMGQALFWYERAAAKNNLQAELALGEFYASSHEASDMKRALMWYNKAAARHSVEAVYNLGQIYYLGQAIPKDYTKAHHYFLQAAKAGYAPAQYNLADMYYYGLGVKKDWIQSYAWLEASDAAKLNPAALALQNKFTEEFTPEQMKQAKDLAASYKHRYSH